MVFQLNRVPELNALVTRTGGQTADPSSLSKTGLLIKAKIDWPDVIFYDGTASDGFTIFIGPLPTPWLNPVTVPADMDAFVVLAPATKLKELTGCRSDKGLPSFRHAMYYDEYAVQCVAEVIGDSMVEGFGCLVPNINTPSDNTSVVCTPKQLFALVSILSGDAFSGKRTSDSAFLKEMKEANVNKETVLVSGPELYLSIMLARMASVLARHRSKGIQPMPSILHSVPL